MPPNTSGQAHVCVKLSLHRLPLNVCHPNHRIAWVTERQIDSVLLPSPLRRIRIGCAVLQNADRKFFRRFSTPTEPLLKNPNSSRTATKSFLQSEPSTQQHWRSRILYIQVSCVRLHRRLGQFRNPSAARQKTNRSPKSASRSATKPVSPNGRVTRQDYAIIFENLAGVVSCGNVILAQDHIDSAARPNLL